MTVLESQQPDAISSNRDVGLAEGTAAPCRVQKLRLQRRSIDAGHSWGAENTSWMRDVSDRFSSQMESCSYRNPSVGVTDLSTGMRQRLP